MVIYPDDLDKESTEEASRRCCQLMEDYKTFRFENVQIREELLKQGLLNEAKEQFDLCIRKNFMYAPTWERLEEVNKRMGNDQEALKNKEMAQFIRKTLQP